MGKIGVDQLSEGMIVDDPVSDLRGTILMQKGTAITRTGIKILKMWGVLEVSVDDASAHEHNVPLPQIDPRSLEEAQNEVHTLFQHTNPDNIFVKELMRLATNRIAETRSERT